MKEIKRHVVRMSGGRTSGFMGDQFRARPDQENITYLFSDTGAEHPETYRFLRNMVKHWGIEITCLRVVITDKIGVGPTYEQVDLKDCKPDLKPFLDMCMKHGTPTIGAPHCSDKIKTIPAVKYCDDTFGPGNYIQWLGMRVDEPGRIRQTKEQLDLFGAKTSIRKEHKQVRYLADISDYTKPDILDWWSKQPFDLGIDEHLGNCLFCIKKDTKKVALAAKDEPEMANQFINMIATDGMRFPAARETPREVMYRGSMSLEGIIEAYKDMSRDELAMRIKYGKSYDSGHCTQSCVSAVADPDLFDI
jgi:3'-phosphoadenosine 5'-phosphosulfate sulfotransferase (PAPS reductase)/FAD synthetase